MNIRKAFGYSSAGGAVDFDCKDFIINWPDGADSIAGNLSTIETLNGIGSIALKNRMPTRTVTLEGYILRNKEANIAKLQRAFSPVCTGTLYCNDGSKTYMLQSCRVTQTPIIGAQWQKPRFQIILTATDPLWYAEEISSLSLASGASVALGSAGSMPMPYTVTVTPSSDQTGGFLLWSSTQQKPMQFGATISAGSTLVISTDYAGKITATLGGSSVVAYAYGALTALLPWDTISANMDCTVTYQEVMAGV